MLLFFIPGERANRAGLLHEHGLDQLVDSPEFRETMAGPTGCAGLLVADQTLGAELLRFEAAKQVWSQRFGFASLVGHWLAHVPTPRTLSRTAQLPGREMELLDGRKWLVPILRAWQDEDSLRFTCSLPRIMQQDPTTGRQMLTKVVPKYRDIWDESLEIAQSLFDQLTGQHVAQIADDHADRYVAHLLGINYRVDASVISHLELLSPDLWAELIRTSLDWETMRAHLKNRLSRHSGGTNT